MMTGNHLYQSANSTDVDRGLVMIGAVNRQQMVEWYWFRWSSVHFGNGSGAAAAAAAAMMPTPCKC